jgi:hypothetical protein
MATGITLVLPEPLVESAVQGALSTKEGWGRFDDRSPGAVRRSVTQYDRAPPRLSEIDWLGVDQ